MSTKAEPKARPAVWHLAGRLRQDLFDHSARADYVYWLISGIPGLFGARLRGRHCTKRMGKCGTNLRVMAGCRIRSMGMVEAGDNVSLGYDNFIDAQGGLVVGSNVTTAPGVKILSIDRDIGDLGVPPGEMGLIEGPVLIEDNVFIASNASILPGTVLSTGCIVSAGAVVRGKTYRPYSVLAGNPARVVGYRGGSDPDAGAQR